MYLRILIVTGCGAERRRFDRGLRDVRVKNYSKKKKNLNLKKKAFIIAKLINLRIYCSLKVYFAYFSITVHYIIGHPHDRLEDRF